MGSLFMLPLYRHAVVFLTALLLAALPLHAAESNPPTIELLKEATVGDRTLTFDRLPAG
jgi:hypothetical protein